MPVKRKKKTSPGTRRKRVTGANTGRKKVTGTKRKRATGRGGAEASGMAIINNIKRLENKRSKLTTKDEKDFLALVINKEHKKLDGVKRNLKKA